MRRQITAAIVAVTALAVAMFGIPLAVAIHHLYVTDARTRLEREATLAARDIPPDFGAGTDPIDLPTDAKGITLGLYDVSGARVSGSGPNVGDVAVRRALLNAIDDEEVGDVLVAAVPVAVNERVVAVIRAETSIRPTERRAYVAWALMAAFGALIVGLAGALAVVQANRVTRPIRRIGDRATRLGHGDFTITVPHAGVTELDDLADALTATARRLGQAMEREQAFSTHASHQLRTPLAGLRLAVETELTDPRADPTLTLHEVLTGIDRLETTVTDLLRLGRVPARVEQLDVDAVYAHVRTHWHGPLAARGRRLDLTPVRSVPDVAASNAAITQALDVLVDNAVRHGAGTVTLAVRPVAGGITISVTDEGPGPGLAPTPEHRTDDHGIGLQLARTLVETERGRLLPPGPGRSSTFAIALPVTTTPPTGAGGERL